MAATRASVSRSRSTTVGATCRLLGARHVAGVGLQDLIAAGPRAGRRRRAGPRPWPPWRRWPATRLAARARSPSCSSGVRPIWSGYRRTPGRSCSRRYPSRTGTRCRRPSALPASSRPRSDAARGAGRGLALGCRGHRRRGRDRVLASVGRAGGRARAPAPGWAASAVAALRARRKRRRLPTVDHRSVRRPRAVAAVRPPGADARQRFDPALADVAARTAARPAAYAPAPSVGGGRRGVGWSPSGARPWRGTVGRHRESAIGRAAVGRVAAGPGRAAARPRRRSASRRWPGPRRPSPPSCGPPIEQRRPRARCRTGCGCSRPASTRR